MPQSQATITDKLLYANHLRFWLALCRGRHGNRLRFLLKDAGLNGSARWNNVFKHCVVEAAVARALGQMLALPTGDCDRLEAVSFLHDALKRAEKRPDDFPPGELPRLRDSFDDHIHAIDPDNVLLAATGPDFLYRFFPADAASLDNALRRLPRLVVLQYYVDTVCEGAALVPPLVRIGEAEKRSPQLNDDPERTRRLGMRYWDAERLLATAAQNLVAKWLTGQGITVAFPDDIPRHIHERIVRFMHGTL
jgi:hypothetical protein